VKRAIVVVLMLAVAATVPGGPSGRAARRTRTVIERPVAARTPRAASLDAARKRRPKPPPDAGFSDSLAALPSGTPRIPDVVATGLGFNGVFPPDTVGEIGPTHFVQMTNGRRGSEVAIFDRNGTRAARFVLSSLAPTGHPCQSGLTDPIPIFDQFAQRWLLTELPFLARKFGICVFVSSGVDPVASTYTVTFIQTPRFPDYHKWGVWPDAYYVGTNELVGRRQTPVAYAIDRAALLEGRPVAVVRRPLPRLKGFDFNPIQPVDLDGDATPPAGAPGIFIRHRDDESHDTVPTAGGDSLELFELTPDFANPDASSVVGPIGVSVAEFSSDLCGLSSFKCIVQPGTRRQLDPIRELVMHRALLRTFADHQSLVGTFSTDIDGNDSAGVRWFELRRPANAAQGGWTLFQEGTVGAVGASRWLGSIAINGAGDIALGYSVSGPSTFPSVAFTGRHAADDLGTMTQGESILAAGTHAQEDSVRWGDYSAMSVDPSDDTTFWFTSEISGPGSAWETKLGSFTF
jgi:hypothetical protein